VARTHLFEFEDLPWFPQVIRQGMMDYLRHMIEWTEFYRPCARVIKDVLQQSNTNTAIELGAGGGGGIMKMLKYLKEINCSPQIVLTDLYPNINTWEQLKLTSLQIDFATESVNALHVPENVKGLRMMFSALHHFKPDEIKSMLTDAVSKNAPVAFFDAGTTNPMSILGVLLIEPITFALLTPFFKPFRWSRLFYTYIISLIVVCTLWDGSVSVLRFINNGNCVIS
jgi:hypothetical protein